MSLITKLFKWIYIMDKTTRKLLRAPKDIGLPGLSLDKPDPEQAQAPSRCDMLNPSAAVPFQIFDEYGTCNFCKRGKPGIAKGTKYTKRSLQRISSDIGATKSEGYKTPEQNANVDKKVLYVEKVSEIEEDKEIQKDKREEVLIKNKIEFTQKSSEDENFRNQKIQGGSVSNTVEVDKQIKAPNHRAPTLSFQTPNFLF